MVVFTLKDLKEKGTTSKENVIKAAARLIKENIREMNYSKAFYSSVADIKEGVDWVPQSLNLFMKLLLSSNLKQTSLSQCIIQATRPRSVIAPIPFGVGISVDKTTGCRQLIKQLARLGFSITPDEVDRFKQSAVAKTDNEGNNPETRIEVFVNACKQWIADNVDHVTTLSGEGTFHGVGMICIGNFSAGGTFGNIPRLKECQPASTFSSNCGVEIIPYH